MGTFDYSCGVYLGETLLKHSDNLCRAIQTSPSHMSPAEYQLLMKLTTKTLTKVHTEEAFLYSGKVLGKVQESCHRTEDKRACLTT